MAVIAAGIEMDPGRLTLQVPVTWWHITLAKEVGMAHLFKALIGQHVMAFFLSGVDLAPPINTAATGAIEQVFGAAVLGTAVAILGQSAVSTVAAGKENEF